MTADLSALIARLEAAEAGSRELDFAVVAWLAFIDDYWSIREPGRWTTSLDAALALAERVLGDGWAMNVCKDEGPADGPEFRWSSQVARGRLGGPAGRRGMFFGVSGTPSLALCIAILRAKAQEG